MSRSTVYHILMNLVSAKLNIGKAFMLLFGVIFINQCNKCWHISYYCALFLLFPFVRFCLSLLNKLLLLNGLMKITLSSNISMENERKTRKKKKNLYSNDMMKIMCETLILILTLRRVRTLFFGPTTHPLTMRKSSLTLP